MRRLDIRRSVINRPLYRFPPFGFFAACITAAAMGNARAAIDDFVELAKAKKGVAATRTLAERPRPSRTVAAAESDPGGSAASTTQAIETAGGQAKTVTGAC